MILVSNFQYIAEDGVLTNPQATERVLIFDEKTELNRRNITLQMDTDTRIPLLSEEGKYFALIDLRELPVVLTEDDEGIIPIFLDTDGVLKMKVKKDIYVNYVQLHYGQKAANLSAFLEYLKRTRHIISFLLHDTRATFHVENLDAPINEDYTSVLQTDEDHVKKYVSQVQEMNGVLTSNGVKLEDGWHIINENGEVTTVKKFMISPDNDPNDADKIAYSIQSLQDDSLHRVDDLELETDSPTMLIKTSSAWDVISNQRVPLSAFLKRNKMIPYDWTGRNKGKFFMVNDEYELKEFRSITAYNSRALVMTTTDNDRYGFNLPLDHYQGAFISDNSYQHGYDIRKIEIVGDKVKITTVNGLQLSESGTKDPEVGTDIVFDYCGVDSIKEKYLFRILEYRGLEYLNTFLSREEYADMGIQVNCSPEPLCPPLPAYRGNEIRAIEEGPDSITLIDNNMTRYVFKTGGQTAPGGATPPVLPPGQGTPICPPLPKYNGKAVSSIRQTAVGGVHFIHEDGSESQLLPPSCPPLPKYNGKEVFDISKRNDRTLVFRYGDGAIAEFTCPQQTPTPLQNQGAKDLIYAALLGVMATNSTFENNVLKLANTTDTDAEIVPDGVINPEDVSPEATTYVDNQKVF